MTAIRQIALMIALIGAASNFNAATAGKSRSFPNTHDGVHLEMVFNYAQSDLNAETGVVDQVWGSSYATLPAGMYPAGMYNAWYIPFSVDDASEAGNTFSVNWYQRHHPDWLEYKCDGTKLAFEFWNHKNAPLDFANPDVIAFQKKHWIDRPLSEGYQSIAVDTIALTNAWKRCGHYDTAHNWVKQYSGRTNDRAFRTDVENWEVLIYDHIHRQSKTATMQVNFSFDPSQSMSDNHKIMTTTDLLFDERGFTNWGDVPNLPTPDFWQTIADQIQFVQSRGICYTTNGEEPELTADITQQERLWVIGNYLLFKDDCTFMYMAGRTALEGQDYGYLITFPEYSANIGHPTSQASFTSGAWQRSYSNGLTLVNPSTDTVDVTLPDGHWVDLNGNTVGSSIELSGQTAQILLKS